MAGISGGGGGGDHLRKKATGVRTWLQLDSTGESNIVEAGKHGVMRRTGLSGLDLRILDPFLSYPSTLIGRERAIIVHLEHIKAIVTAHEVLLLNSREPSVVPFVEELRHRIMQHHQATEALSREEESLLTRGQNGENTGPPLLLPFEFVVLEACLDAACGYLDEEATALEEEAYPALDEVTSKINTLNLERVHRIKNRLAQLFQRVQKVRDELERLLNNDEYMAKMYLTNKHAVERQLRNSSLSSIKHEIVQRVLDERVSGETLVQDRGNSSRFSVDFHPAEQHHQQRAIRTASSLSRGSQFAIHTSSRRYMIGKSKHLGVKDVEIIVEAYFVRVDATLSGLSTLREYVDDTEDYINIMLDDTRNRMMQKAVLFMTAGVVLMAFTTVTGVFSMNIHDFSLFQKTDPPNYYFILFCGGGTACSIVLYLIAISWYKHLGLM
ncbi:magnesium transporter MRS2-3-like [Coffea eugenioides]|uniref:Magnesium transporter n=1 Tax=Coffea arabica TaxID=13443 RepID=A0ABM4WV27_COFAR|nr:magnesium transporter MRS2-3-like [Coffea eugenioides]